jgi:hypothetical protein
MSDDKWEKADAMLRKQAGGAVVKTGGADTPLAPISEKIEAIRKQELDIIGRFKRNALDRNAALEAMRAMHDAHLDATKHTLKRAIEVEKARVDTVANKYIFHITAEYLHNMAELGVKNIESRTETLLKFNETIARLLEQAQAQDVPSAIRDMTIENILKQHREFVDKVMKEEFNLSK